MKMLHKLKISIIKFLIRLCFKSGHALYICDRLENKDPYDLNQKYVIFLSKNKIYYNKLTIKEYREKKTQKDNSYSEFKKRQDERNDIKNEIFKLNKEDKINSLLSKYKKLDNETEIEEDDIKYKYKYLISSKNQIHLFSVWEYIYKYPFMVFIKKIFNFSEIMSTCFFSKLPYKHKRVIKFLKKQTDYTHKYKIISALKLDTFSFTLFDQILNELESLNILESKDKYFKYNPKGYSNYLKYFKVNFTSISILLGSFLALISICAQTDDCYKNSISLINKLKNWIGYVTTR